MNTITYRVLLGVVAGWMIVHAGCSRPANPNLRRTPTENANHVLSADEAAALAARLANDLCEKRYRKRPFNAENHRAIQQEGKFHWGHLDVGGVGGYSALVTFHQDGSDPHVEVYFSTDALR